MLKKLWEDYSEIIADTWNGYGCYDYSLSDMIIGKFIAFCLVLASCIMPILAVSIVVMLVMHPIALAYVSVLILLSSAIIWLALRTDLNRRNKSN